MPFYEVDLLDEPQSLIFEVPSQGHDRNKDNDTPQTLQWERHGIELPLASSNMLLSDQDAISLNRSCEIVDNIRSAIITKSLGSKILVTWSDPIEAMCLQFFSPTSIERYLTLFWFAWHPNCPFIHRSSFDSTTCHLNLVIAMVVIGACISPVESDRAMANVWFNVVEEIIFNDPAFSINSMSQVHETTKHTATDRLSTLQAGYCVCLYQTWEGTKDDKLRARRHRYNAVIGVCHN